MTRRSPLRHRRCPRRSLVRRLPDGQLYRASPADYWIPVEGVDGLGTRLDPMGSTITCQSRHVSRREAPQDVAWALGLPSGGLVRMVRCVWSAGGDPAAVSTAYLPGTALGAGDDDDPEAPVLADAAQAGGGQAGGGQAGAAQAGAGQADAEVASFDALLSGPAAAVSLEMSPPQPAVARSLRLSPGQPVITVTVRFDDAETGRPAALTVVVLKPELFRVALEATGAPAAAPTLSVSVSKGQLPGLSGRYLRL